MSRKVTSERLRTAADVARSILGDSDAGSSLPAQESGERNIMVVSARERMGSVLARIEKIGLPLSIALRRRGGLVTFQVRAVPEDNHVHDDDVWRIGATVTISMLADALREKGGSLLLHLTETDLNNEVDYEVVGV